MIHLGPDADLGVDKFVAEAGVQREIIVSGTGRFGLAVAEALADDGHVTRGVVAPVEERNGRPGLLYGWAQRRRVEVRDKFDPDWVRGTSVGLIVAAHSHAFIGQRTRQAADAIGYHPSLLPRHRGRDAVRWTVKMGDPVAGGSVYRFDRNVDGGPVLLQDWCHVRPGWSASDLWREALFPMGVRLLRLAVAMPGLESWAGTRQDEELATWEPSWERPPLFRPELVEIGGSHGVARSGGGRSDGGRVARDSGGDR